MYQRLCKNFFLVALLAIAAVNSAHGSVPVFETSSATGTIVLVSTQGLSMGPHKAYGKSVSSGKTVPVSFESSIVTYDASVLASKPTLGSPMRLATFSFLASPAGSYAVSPFAVPASRLTNTNGVSVLPEINSWVMTLIGLGLITFQLVRKGRMRGAALRVG
jgi:hypothetical protein